VGQLGESGEYWMGTVERCVDNSEFQGGSPTCVDSGTRHLGPHEEALNSTNACWIYGV
jgi:hypothetical protein